MEQEHITVELRQQTGYRFAATYGPSSPPLLVDEYPPLGDGAGPNPTRLLATAIAHCLSSSLLFCLRKAKIEPLGIRTTANVSLARNETGRLRVGAIDVSVVPTVKPEDQPRMSRCLELFEDYCVVTASVRKGVAVSVRVTPTTAD